MAPYLRDTTLGVTTKQVARYWDNGWIEGRYRTQNGHRRIDYTDDTVEQVRFKVGVAKETNLQIRYHLTKVEFGGRVVSLDGCNNMQDVYTRLRGAGLGESEARQHAFSARIASVDSRDDADLETLYTTKGTSVTEIAETRWRLRDLPLFDLLQAADDADFRNRARIALDDIITTMKAREEWDTLPSEERISKRQNSLATFKKLLSKRSLASFLAAWKNAPELHHRFTTDDATTYAELAGHSDERHAEIQLKAAATKLKHMESTTRAVDLARLFGISRQKLYRRFTAEQIQEALKAARNDVLAICESRNDKVAKGKKGK